MYFLDDAHSDQGQQTSATERAEASRDRYQRHVWIREDDFLRAIPVVTGLSNSQYTELVEGELVEGQALVTGVRS